MSKYLILALLGLCGCGIMDVINDPKFQNNLDAVNRTNWETTTGCKYGTGEIGQPCDPTDLAIRQAAAHPITYAPAPGTVIGITPNGAPVISVDR